MNEDWKSWLLRRDKSIRDAMAIINDRGLRTALVVDEHEVFVGSVTDGDIRRGLLDGCSLSDSVERVMNREPKTVDEQCGEQRAMDIMTRQQIHCIPVLRQQRVVAVFTRKRGKKPRYDNPVFLMAGGRGKRLRPLTNHCPKPLLKIGDTPILEIILERFILAGFHRFTISTHYLSDMFKAHFGRGEKWGVTIDYVEERSPLGTAGALGLLDPELLTHPLIVMNGDILTGVDFAELLHFHHHRQGVATVCVSEYEYEIPFGVVNSADMCVQSIAEKPMHRVQINSGI